jgi:hypothetical protein
MVFLATSPALSAMIPSSKESFAQSERHILQEDLNTIEQALETKIVQYKLKAHGLSSEEVSSKLASMNQNQIHLLAVASSDVLHGGDAGTVVWVVGVIMTVFALYTLLNFIIKSLTSKDEPS